MIRVLAALRRCWRALLALARDVCASVYASYPDERVEEAMREALEGEDD